MKTENLKKISWSRRAGVFIRFVRRTFRWSRRTGYFVLLTLIYAGYHLNQIGLPPFAKDALLGRLRTEGLDLDFRRARIRLDRGIVIEGVTGGRFSETSGETLGERVSADELEVDLDWRKLLRFESGLRGVRIHGGRITLPVGETNEPARLFELTVDEGSLRFMGPHFWSLEELQGTCLGLRFTAMGTLTNVVLAKSDSVRPIKDFRPIKRGLARLMKEVERSVFRQPPRLTANFRVDIADLTQSAGSIRLKADDIQWDQAVFESLALSAELNPFGNARERLQAAVVFESGPTTLLKGSVGALRLETRFEAVPDGSTLVTGGWELSAKSLNWDGNKVGSLKLKGSSDAVLAPLGATLRWKLGASPKVETAHAFRSRAVLEVSDLELTNRVASPSCTVELEADHSHLGWIRSRVGLKFSELKSRELTSGPLRLDLLLNPALKSVTGLPETVMWDWLGAIELQVATVIERGTMPDLVMDQVSVGAAWSGGVVSLKKLDARLFGGQLEGSGTLDAVTRQVSLEFRSDADPAGVKPLLREASRRWVGQFDWTKTGAPQIAGRLRMTLPPWVNKPENWQGTLQDSLRLAGSFSGGPFQFRGIGAETVKGTFNYSNRVWRIRDLQATAGSGRVALVYDGDERTKDYWFSVRSEMDPSIVLPLFPEPRIRRVFAEIKLNQPPSIQAEIRGRWFEPERIGIRGTARVNDLSFRGEHLDRLDAVLGYTNLFLSVGQASFLDGKQNCTVEGFAYDIEAGLISFTNAVSTFLPSRVTQVIGSKVQQTMKPYIFDEPATIRANGVIGIRGDPTLNNIRFDVESAPKFRWWKFVTTGISGSVLSLGPLLVVSNLHAGFHGGRLDGVLEFDLGLGASTTFRIDTVITNANLKSLIRDLSTQSNRTDGVISGRLKITEGEASNMSSWKGIGSAQLRDGYLWDQPLFGALSQVMSGVSSGMGKTRFSEGAAHFKVDSGRLLTRDLRLRSPSMRLAFVGSIGFERDLDMIVQGALFREVPLLGPVASIVLIPFEKLLQFKVGGSLEKPITQPAHIPSLLFVPLNPIGTFLELLPEPKGAAPLVNPVPSIGQ